MDRRGRRSLPWFARNHSPHLRRGGVSPPANIRFSTIKREAKRLPYNRKPPPTSVGEGSPLPHLRKELPLGEKILRYAPFANGEYNDNEREKVRQVRLVRVVSFLYRLSSFRVILSAAKNLFPLRQFFTEVREGRPLPYGLVGNGFA